MRFSAVVILFLLPVGVAAQSRGPADVREHVMRLTDTEELLRIERSNAGAADATDALAAGFAALRLTELTGDRDHAHRARSYFDRIADRDPSNPWAHYGYALSFGADIEHERGGIVSFANASIALGIDARSRARRALERAVALDPALPGALALLAQYAAETNDDDALEQAREALSQAQRAGRARPDEVVALAATTRRLGDYEGAADIARHLTATEDPSAAGLLELSHALAHVPGQSVAAGTFFLRALAAADPAVLQAMWSDAAVLARENERDEWDRASHDERRAMLQRFWDMRAALAGITTEERIAEHYVRLDYAAGNYARRGMYGAPSSNSLELGRIDETFDDRGVIYIRHGAPIDILRYAQKQVARHETNTIVRWESWAYPGDSAGTVLYHFALFPTDYVEPIETGRGAQRLMPGGGSIDYVLVRNVDCGVVDDRHLAYDRRLSRLAFRCDPLERRTVGAVVRRDAHEALRTESVRPLLTTALPFHFEHYTFRGANGQTEIVSAVGVPLDRLGHDRVLRLSLTIADTANGTFARAQLETPPAPAATAGLDMLRTHLSLLAAPAPDALYRIAIADAEDVHAGKMYGGRIEVPDYRGTTPLMSDIVIAEPAGQGTFSRGATRLSLSPTQVFARGEFRVFYEIYNLAPGATYRTEIAVESADGGLRAALKRLFGKEDPVVLAFAGVAPDNIPNGVLQEVRAVQAQLPPGAYRLKVTISADGLRRSLVRERRFTVE